MERCSIFPFAKECQHNQNINFKAFGIVITPRRPTIISLSTRRLCWGSIKLANLISGQENYCAYILTKNFPPQKTRFWWSSRPCLWWTTMTSPSAAGILTTCSWRSSGRHCTREWTVMWKSVLRLGISPLSFSFTQMWGSPVMGIWTMKQWHSTSGICTSIKQIYTSAELRSCTLLLT